MPALPTMHIHQSLVRRSSKDKNVLFFTIFIFFYYFFFNDKIPTLIKYPFNVKHLKILKLLGYSNLWRILKLKALKWFSGIVRGWLFGGLKGLSIFASFVLTGEVSHSVLNASNLYASQYKMKRGSSFNSYYGYENM